MQTAGLALHTDKYQINMMYAHWINGSHRTKAVFEGYFRKLPFGNGYAVFAGLERIVHYIESLRFSDDDIAYLAKQEEKYQPEFLEELRRFRFTGNIYSMKEGALVFPNQPLIRVEGSIFETQLVETALLNFMNFQTLIATKLLVYARWLATTPCWSSERDGRRRRMPRSGGHVRLMSRDSMPRPTCWPARSSAYQRKARMPTPGFRRSAVSRKHSISMPR
ncbi:nicotinate phosphoribosyltransferase [Paenibacillus sp. JCM 10914]|nr:nicotinate phosphoribosyltransferase [Paenibacillus sp. JCM 10914]